MLLSADKRREVEMGPAEKVSITMTSDMLRAVRESVETGEYASTSEVLRDAVRLWRRRRAEDAESLAAIRTRVQRSIDDPRASLGADAAEIEMKRFLDEVEKQRANAAA
jgi:antitoxin ParD1/3/4